MSEKIRKGRYAAPVADEAMYRGNQGAGGGSAFVALSNARSNFGTVASVAAGAFASAGAAVTITPKVSGKFVIIADSYGTATNGLTACAIRIFDGSTAVGSTLTGTAMAGVATTGGGTVNNATVGGGVTAIGGGYALGTPVTFTVQVNPTTQAYSPSLSHITVFELPA